jgi:hypothetical protein
MSRYFVPITTDELKNKIFTSYNKVAKSNSEEPIIIKQLDGYSTADTNVLSSGVVLSLNSKLEKDLKKVAFDTENFLFKNTDMYHLGFHTLENGLSFWICAMGGDWEYPVHFIIYFDGSDLRGYIPTNGNPYNRSTKEAYGNDEDSDEKDAMKHFNVSWDEVEQDYDAIVADIKNRIVRK